MKQALKRSNLCSCLLNALSLISLALVSLVLPASSFATPLETIRVQSHWLEQFEFAGFYVAKERGFYEKVGLEVELLPHAVGETDVVANVLSGKADFGINYSSLLADYSLGKPVVALAAIFQKSPLVLLARDATDLEDASDLKGKKIMIGGDALQAAPIMALLFSHYLRTTDIVQQRHTHDVEDLIAGRTDAMTAYISNEPFQMTSRGAKFKIFDPSKTGLSFYENFLFTSKEMTEQHPERVARFLDATLQGFTHAFDNIEETAALIHENYNEQGRSLEALVFEGQELRDRALVDDTRLGQIDPARLVELANVFRLMGVDLSDKPIADFVWEDARAFFGSPLDLTQSERLFIRATNISVASTTNWPPFAFVDQATDNVAGIGHDFWQEIVSIAELNQEITTYDKFSQELADLKDKKLDVLFSVGATPERRDYALFSKPYASFPLAIATSKEENFIPDASHLTGRKIAIGRNFTAHRMMQDSHPNLDYLPVSNIADGLQAVSRGDAYAYIDIMPALAYNINQLGFTNLKISGDTGLTFDLRIMVRDDYPELVSIADKVIAGIPEARRQEIIHRWVNVQYEKGYDLAQLQPWLIGGGAIVLICFAWLLHAKRQADRANRMKSEFLALMSHDLRTPLNAIMGFSDIMRTQALGPMENPRYREYSEDIHRSGQLLVSLINDILDLSKIEAGKYELSEETIDVDRLIEECIHGCGVLASDRGILLSSDMPENLRQLRADTRVFTQILNNLLSNAIKFSDDKGQIWVRAGYSDQDQLWIAVVDEGIGMTKEEIARVTKPFEQLSRENTSRVEGTGLGLHVCQSFMQLLSGTLLIESTAGRGTTVTITFPPERNIPSTP